MKIKTLSNQRDEKKIPKYSQKILCDQVYINSTFFLFLVYVRIFSGLGFNFRVKWFMGLCPYFHFFGLNFRVKFSGETEYGLMSIHSPFRS